MKSKIEFNCLPTGIGSMPHTSASEACLLVNKYLPLPYWPQLPHRSPLENMYVQFSEGFPGVVINDGKITVDRSGEFVSSLEKLYNDHTANNPDDYGISARYAAGLHEFLSLKQQRPQVAKGQVTGPISWGLSVTDAEGRGILYDELLAETIAKFLHLKAMWQERLLRTVSPDTIIFVDEPYLAAMGSAFVAISNKQVTGLLEEVLSGIQGIKGIHCCGSTDWSLLLKSSTDILSFDTYNYADSLSTYSGDVKPFLERCGTIAWGIVPNEEEFLLKETVSSLYDRLGEAVSVYTHDGISFRQIIAQSIITPSCALTSLSPDAAEQALKTLAELSDKVRKKYT